jgi:hypothetical protein
MRSEKAWYWLAAGVLALGVNGAYRDGQLSWAHCLAGRAASMVERASERGLRFVTVAEVMLGRSPETFGWAETTLQSIQTKVVCERVAQAQRQIAMAQVHQQFAQDDLRRKLDLAQMKMARVRMISVRRAERFRNCPGFSRMVVEMPAIPKIDLSNLPDIQIPDLPEVPQTPERSNGPI